MIITSNSRVVLYLGNFTLSRYNAGLVIYFYLVFIRFYPILGKTILESPRILKLR